VEPVAVFVAVEEARLEDGRLADLTGLARGQGEDDAFLVGQGEAAALGGADDRGEGETSLGTDAFDGEIA